MNDYDKLKNKRMNLTQFELYLILWGLSIGGVIGIFTSYLEESFMAVCTGVLLFSIFVRTGWPLWKDLKVRWRIRSIKKANKLVKQYHADKKQSVKTTNSKTSMSTPQTEEDNSTQREGAIDSSEQIKKKENRYV